MVIVNDLEITKIMVGENEIYKMMSEEKIVYGADGESPTPPGPTPEIREIFLGENEDCNNFTWDIIQNVPGWENGRKVKLFKFVPTLTWQYKIYFDDTRSETHPEYSDTDTYMYLYDENMNIIMENDDSHGGSDPEFYPDLVEYNNYYIGITHYNGEPIVNGSIFISEH